MANARSAHVPPLTARAAHLVACTTCGRVHPAETRTCVRCGAALSSRDDTSLQRVWAWMIAGLFAYGFANYYPMLQTTTLGKTTSNTLLGGVIELFIHGSYAIGMIVFVASIVIPVFKFWVIARLSWQVRYPGTSTAHRRHKMYEIVEFIGRWSMIDVFVVALLSSLVQLGSAISVHPGIAAVSFALSVAFTMLAALSFDCRMIWDADKDIET